jgi:Zn-dependent protease
LFIFTPIFFFFLINALTALAILIFLILLTFSITIHELGHAHYARQYQVYVQEIILLPFSGITVRQNKPKNDLDEMRIAIIGPLINFIIVLCTTPLIFYLYSFENVMTIHIYEFSPIINFFQINLALTIFNIIPLYPMDGGRILRSYLSYKYEYKKATILVTRLTYILAIAMVIIGLIFNLILAVLALFLYIAAHSKRNFDIAAEVLGAGDSPEKKQVMEQYKAEHRELMERTTQFRIRMEKSLQKSLFGLIADFYFRIRRTLDHELVSGKLKRFQVIIFKLLTLLLKAKDFIELWLKHHPKRKSIVFMLIASICFTLVWISVPKFFMVFGAVFILSFITGSFIIFYHTRSNNIKWLTIFGCFFWLLYLITELLAPSININYTSYLYFEGIRGCFVPLTGILFFSTIINSNNFFKKAETYMPLPSIFIIATLYLIGTAILLYEIYLISAYEGILDSVRFTLRYDISYLIWFFASAMIFSALLYMIYLASLSKYGRITTVKVIIVTVVVMLLFSFFTRDLLILALGRYSTDPDDLDLKIGLNANNITKLDINEFDKAFHLEVTWKRVYRNGPSQPNWSSIDWQLDFAERNGIDIYLLIHPSPPKWFIDQHTDAIMEDQWGQEFIWIDKDPASNKTSIWDLSFNDPEVLKAKVDFTVETVKRYHNLSTLQFISIQNEPLYPVDFNNLRMASYDEQTVTAFRKWINNKYNNDTELIEAERGISIEDLSELDAPRTAANRFWRDWLSFREDSLIWLVENLTGAVKAHTTKPVTVKALGHFLWRYSTIQTGLSNRVLERFFELSDVISLDLYPLTIADLQHSLEFYKKLAGDKKIIVPEFNMVLGANYPGAGSLLYYYLVILNNYVDYVFIFTGDDHYIYGINLYDHSPVHIGLKLYRTHRSGGDVFTHYDELLRENLLSIPNYYEIFVFAATVWSLPVLPWPVLLLVITPLPIVEEDRLKKAKIVKYGTIIILLIVFTVVANLP